MSLEGETRLTLSRGTQAAQRCSCELSSFMSSSAGRACACCSAAPPAPGLAPSSWRPWNNGWFVSPFYPGRNTQKEATSKRKCILFSLLHQHSALVSVWLAYGSPWWDSSYQISFLAPWVAMETMLNRCFCRPGDLWLHPQPVCSSEPHRILFRIMCFYINRRGKKQALHFSKYFSQSSPVFWISWSLSASVYIYYSIFMLSYWFIRNA